MLRKLAKPEFWRSVIASTCRSMLIHHPQPAGAVEIKYRERDILETIRRVDDTVRALNFQLAAAIAAKDASLVADLKKQITSREEMLTPIYRQVQCKL